MKQPLPPQERIEWPDNCHFFLTSSTFLHFPYFKDLSQKQLVINKIKQIKKTLNIPKLYDNPFSSFQYIADKYGFDFACNIVKNVIYVEEDKDGIVKLDDFEGCGVVKP